MLSLLIYSCSKTRLILQTNRVKEIDMVKLMGLANDIHYLWWYYK